MKIQEPKEVIIDDTTFYIRPFSALYSANISGELSSFIVPVFTVAVPFLSSKNKDKEELLDIDVSDFSEALSGASTALQGDKVESLIRKLIITEKKIAYKDDRGQVNVLDEDALDALFCGNTQSLFMLAWEVIKTNYSGFFEKLANRFGSQGKELVARILKSTEN